jgi:putative hydrolase of the HAD superfamily
MFDAYLFDAGGVLVLPDPTVLGPLLAPYGGSTELEDHRRAHYAGMAAKARVEADERTWHHYDAAYVEQVRVSGSDRDEAALLLGSTRTPHLWRWPIQDSVSALAALESAGVPIGVVSNASGQIEATLNRAGICQVGPGPGAEVLCIIDSHVVGIAKPDPMIFEFALPHFGSIPRHRIAYIGDSMTMDVAGSRAAGLTPILIDPFDDHVGADVRRISKLHDLID